MSEIHAPEANEDIDLPDLSQVWPDPDDHPVVILEKLVAENARRMSAASAAVVRLEEAHPQLGVIYVQAFLEALLRAVGGEMLVVEASIEANTRIATLLDEAEPAVAEMKRRQALTEGIAPAPGFPGSNRAGRRHG